MNFPITLTGTTNTLLWAEEDKIEAQALQQLREIGKLDEVIGLRVMPDVHYGKGATVGSVIAMKNALAPAAVGVDIGCGVAAVKTNLKESDLSMLSLLRSAIENTIPVGFHGHNGVEHLKNQDDARRLLSGFEDLTVIDSVRDRESKVSSQCGTLGGGNHFIEVCADEEGSIWLTLHSGSRNIGKEIAEIHIAKAKGLEHNESYGDMAVFHGGTKEMDAYLHDLHWAQNYAATSRGIMMDLLRQVVQVHFFVYLGKPVVFGEEINVHHNYVAHEVIDGEEAVVTRKGAIRAGKGDLALIPGSMGTGSYIVKGLGSDESYQSASHGAGRKMSRTKAKKTYTTDDLEAQTAGIECRKDAGVVDEIPGAYKDLHGVIEAQSGLVQPVAHLRTLLCVKG